MCSKGIANKVIDIDDDSKRCRFGWGAIGGKFIPYLFRTEAKVKYVAVRMLERQIINEFIAALPNEITTLHRKLHCMRGSAVTKAELLLLDEINLQHSDAMYGKDKFTWGDKIVPLEEAIEYYNFLKFCYERLVSKKPYENNKHRAGFIKMDGNHEIPFVVLGNSRKYLPVSHFEEIPEHIDSYKICGWDLVYVKFCCNIQGIKKELFPTDTCHVISMEEVLKDSPPDTRFDECWPQKHTITMKVTTKTAVNANSA